MQSLKKSRCCRLFLLRLERELDARIFDIAKGNDPSVLKIGGGTHFTNLNVNQHGAKELFCGQCIVMLTYSIKGNRDLPAA